MTQIGHAETAFLGLTSVHPDLIVTEKHLENSLTAN